jgi:GlpG protein
MKKLCTIENVRDGKVFSDYLISQGLDNQAEEETGGIEIWILDENQIEFARVEYDLFSINPADPKYGASVKTANRIRKEQQRQNAKSSGLHVPFKAKGMVKGIPKFTLILIIISIVITLFTNFGSNYSLFYFTYNDFSTPFFRLQKGELWRLITPIFIHFHFIHILFNMLWLKDLGGLIESRKGAVKFLLIVLSIGVFSNTFEYMISFYPRFGGMSGVVYGLLGYVYVKMKTQPHEGLAIEPGLFKFMMIWLILCMTGMFGSIANGAHISGLVSGAFIAYIPVLIKKIK